MLVNNIMGELTDSGTCIIPKFRPYLLASPPQKSERHFFLPNTSLLTDGSSSTDASAKLI